jgi:type I restriction enzyme M protein
VGDYAFISHMVETTQKANGRVGVVAPHGILFRGGAEGKIRQKLIEENLVDAVIGLPPGLFFGAGIQTCIMLLKRDKKGDSILFIDASRGFEQGNPQNTLRKQDIEQIVKTYKTRKTIEKYSFVASYEEVKDKDYSLNIPRYVDLHEPELEIDIKKVQKEIDQLENQLLQVRRDMHTYLKELGYGS